VKAPETPQRVTAAAPVPEVVAPAAPTAPVAPADVAPGAPVKTTSPAPAAPTIAAAETVVAPAADTVPEPPPVSAAPPATPTVAAPHLPDPKSALETAAAHLGPQGDRGGTSVRASQGSNGPPSPRVANPASQVELSPPGAQSDDVAPVTTARRAAAGSGGPTGAPAMSGHAIPNAPWAPGRVPNSTVAAGSHHGAHSTTTGSHEQSAPKPPPVPPLVPLPQSGSELAIAIGGSGLLLLLLISLGFSQAPRRSRRHFLKLQSWSPHQTLTLLEHPG
jgi:hypothetical protein